MTKRFRRVSLGWAALVAAVAVWSGAASASAPFGCVPAATSSLTVFTVGVSAAGTPVVRSSAAPPPAATGVATCVPASVPPGSATFLVNGPGVSVYPLSPPVSPGGPGVPTTIHLLQVGSYLLTVPYSGTIQVYQIGPGFYVVRSLDPSQNVNIVLPLPGVPPAPNTGPIPTVGH